MAVDRKRLYIVWENAALVAYSIETNKIIWQADITDTRSPPDVVVCGESKVCLQIRNRVEIYDSASGIMLARIEVGKGDEALLYPVYDGKDTLYVFLNSIRDTSLVSLDLRTNNQNWSSPIPLLDYPPAVSGGTLYIPGAKPRKLLALEASTGHSVWESNFDSDILQTPVEFHDRLYVRDYSGMIHVVNRTDGEELGSLTTLPYGIEGIIGVDDFAIRPVVMNEQILIIPSGAEIRGYVPKDSH